jgi:hypothetical protein
VAPRKEDRPSALPACRPAHRHRQPACQDHVSHFPDSHCPAGKAAASAGPWIQGRAQIAPLCPFQSRARLTPPPKPPARGNVKLSTVLGQRHPSPGVSEAQCHCHARKASPFALPAPLPRPSRGPRHGSIRHIRPAPSRPCAADRVDALRRVPLLIPCRGASRIAFRWPSMTRPGLQPGSFAHHPEIPPRSIQGSKGSRKLRCNPPTQSRRRRCMLVCRPRVFENPPWIHHVRLPPLCRYGSNTKKHPPPIAVIPGHRRIDVTGQPLNQDTLLAVRQRLLFLHIDHRPHAPPPVNQSSPTSEKDQSVQMHHLDNQHTQHTASSSAVAGP